MEFLGTKGKRDVYNNTTTRKGKLGIVMSWDEKGQNPIEIASIYTSQAKANAQLIAHSPLLLQAIKDSINELRECGLNAMADYHESLYNQCVNF